MAWQKAHALYISVPYTPPYNDNWVEQVLGAVVKPLSDHFQADILWMWVTRYAGSYQPDRPPLGYELPEPYRGNGQYRHIIFRLSATDESRENIHQAALRYAADAGCFVGPGWIDYDVVANLGRNRFIHEGAGPEERSRRAHLIAQFIDATLRLFLDAIIETNGVWKLEANSDVAQNPKGSFFQSIHHFFCNLTGVPTHALLSAQNNNLLVTTYIALSWGVVEAISTHPETILPHSDQWVEVRLRY